MRHFADCTTCIAVTLLTLLLTGFIMLAYVTPALHRYERANNYPFGKLCDLYRNCPTPTR